MAHSQVSVVLIRNGLCARPGSHLFIPAASSPGRKPVHLHRISGRFDVGNLPSYLECDRYFREELQDDAPYML